MDHEHWDLFLMYFQFSFLRTFMSHALCKGQMMKACVRVFLPGDPAGCQEGESAAVQVQSKVLPWGCFWGAHPGDHTETFLPAGTVNCSGCQAHVRGKPAWKMSWIYSCKEPFSSKTIITPFFELVSYNVAIVVSIDHAYWYICFLHQLLAVDGSTFQQIKEYVWLPLAYIY